MEAPRVYLKKSVNLRDSLTSKGMEFETPEVDYNFNSEDEEETPAYFDNEENMTDLFLGMSDKDVASNKSDWINQTFNSIAKGMNALTSDKGILKQVIKEGYGNAIPPKSQIICHYNSFFEKQAEPFDSSRLRNNPLKFVLGDGQVVPGFDFAVASMRQGEISEFIVHSNYAYGRMGCPPRIPADASVFYVIELISFIETYVKTNDGADSSSENSNEFNFNKTMTAAKTENLFGNEKYKEGSYILAKNSYRRALRLIEPLNLANEKEEDEHQKLLKKLHLNLAQCFLLLKEPRVASFHCKRVLEVDNRNIKALFRCGKANRILGEFELASQLLKRALNIEPKDEAIIQEIHKNNLDHKAYNVRQKKFCQKMFGEVPKEDDNLQDIPQLSLKFQETIKEQLASFVANESLHEYPCGFGFTEDELSFIAQTGKDFGLHCVYLEIGDAKLKLIKSEK